MNRRLDELFGVLAMEPMRARRMTELVRGIDLRSHVESHVPAPRERDYEIVGGVAVLSLCGVMSKSGVGDSMTRTVSTTLLRRDLRLASSDPAVRSILLLVDSPGGVAAGTHDLAAEVARIVASGMEVVSFIEDCGCSAAYWVASQATRIVANTSAIIGSIGTYAVVDDVSKMYESRGITTHVIRAGRFKGAGVDGTPVTDEQIAEWQREVDAINALFLRDVSRGRRMSDDQVNAIADGRCHIASEALRLGLIDEVGTIDGIVSVLNVKKELIAMPVGICKLPDGSEKEMDQVACEEAGGEWIAPDKANPDGGGQAVPDSSPEGPLRQSASIAELKAALPSSTAEQRESWFERGLSVAQAAVELCAEQAKAIDELRAKLSGGGKAVPFASRGADSELRRMFEAQRGKPDGIDDFEKFVEIEKKVDAASRR